ncbi:MAG: sulfotransferase family protein [Cycloclasticus sp.]
MTIKVIGVGFGRTGTLSLKTALEKLGYAECYHMLELFSRADHAKTWLGIANGEQPDWPELFDGYQSLVDWPTAFYWREHLTFYPDAKVILTVRDPNAWYSSMSKTIFPAIESAFPEGATVPQLPDDAPPFAADQIIVGKTLIADRLFQGRLQDKDFCISQYQQHIKDVKDAVPADNLLVFDVKKGWGPLCQFLGINTPNEPFPRANSQEEFSKKLHNA